MTSPTTHEDGELISLLWMDEIIDDEDDVLARIVASAGMPDGSVTWKDETVAEAPDV
mgnify:CR=1 FL=1